MAWHNFRPVGLDFLQQAKKVYVLEAQIPQPRDKVWQAICDADNWHLWFPGVLKASYGDSQEPYGVGTRRYAKVGKAKYEETMLAWDEGERFAYRIDRATVPIAHAQVESTELEDIDIGTRLKWVLACDRKLMLLLMAPYFKPYLQGIWNKVGLNLEGYIAQQD